MREGREGSRSWRKVTVVGRSVGGPVEGLLHRLCRHRPGTPSVGGLSWGDTDRFFTVVE